MEQEKQKDVESLTNEILTVFEDLSSTDLSTILRVYKEKGILVIADKLRTNYAYYNKDKNIIILDKEFVKEDRNDDELAYILLHEYFHVHEQISASLSKENSFREYADIYARFVFIQEEKEIPKIFMPEATK